VIVSMCGFAGLTSSTWPANAGSAPQIASKLARKFSARLLTHRDPNFSGEGPLDCGRDCDPDCRLGCDERAADDGDGQAFFAAGTQPLERRRRSWRRCRRLARRSHLGRSSYFGRRMPVN
jgi:hypothetical protein